MVWRLQSRPWRFIHCLSQQDWSRLEYRRQGDSTGAWNQMNDKKGTCVWREFRTDVWSGMCKRATNGNWLLVGGMGRSKSGRCDQWQWIRSPRLTTKEIAREVWAGGKQAKQTLTEVQVLLLHPPPSFELHAPLRPGTSHRAQPPGHPSQSPPKIVARALVVSGPTSSSYRRSPL